MLQAVCIASANSNICDAPANSDLTTVLLDMLSCSVALIAQHVV